LRPNDPGAFLPKLRQSRHSGITVLSGFLGILSIPINEWDIRMSDDNGTKKTIFCSSCGAANLVGSKFCSECGAKILALGSDNPINTSVTVSSPQPKGKNKIVLRSIFPLMGIVGGYMLGSSILPMLSYTSWERHVVATNTSNYTSALRGAYSSTALMGGIVGAIVLFVVGLVLSRLFFK
jgi:hypothetical protein